LSSSVMDSSETSSPVYFLMLLLSNISFILLLP
jgi:hypothetical protein